MAWWAFRVHRMNLVGDGVNIGDALLAMNALNPSLNPDKSAILPAHRGQLRGAVASALSVFLFVFAAQVWFVGRVASEVPWGDSWGSDGVGLFPAWVEGTWEASDLLQPHNEHRIMWTRLLNLGLFVTGH